MLKVSLNGNILPAAQAKFDIDNRAFRYGDSVFETCRFAKHKIPLLALHFTRLTECLRYIGMEIPAHWNLHYFEEGIRALARANEMDFCRVRITASRQGGGLYTPEKNEPDILIETLPLAQEQFDVLPFGISLGEFHAMQKSIHPVFSCKSGNAILYVLAAKYAREKKWDDVLIFNEKGEIAEAISSNVWVIKNGVFYTTPDDSGAVLGVMRRYLLDNARNLHIEAEQISLTPEILLSADEVFLSNAIHGIRSVHTYQDRTYLNNSATALLEELNRQLF